MGINLSNDLAEKYKTVKWLTDPIGNRRTGKTYLMALGFVENSLKYNAQVPIYDHNPFIDTRIELMGYIKSICLKLNVDLNVCNKGSSIYVKKKINEKF